jgi:hypothetical protein
VRIACELAPIYHGSATEDCVFKVRAETADGTRKIWDGVTWHMDRQARKGRRGEEGSITLHDVKIDNWVLNVPEDDFLMESVGFQALYLTTLDEVA